MSKGTVHGLWFIGDIKYIIVIFTDIAIMIILGKEICNEVYIFWRWNENLNFDEATIICGMKPELDNRLLSVCCSTPPSG